MENNYLFSNKSFDNYEESEFEKNSLFFNNNPEDNLLHSYNNEEKEEYNYNYNYNYNEVNNNMNNINEFLSNSYNNINLNLKLDNSIQFKNNNFQENNSLKDLSSIEQISQMKNDEDSGIGNSSSINLSNNSSSTKEKSQLKNIEININTKEKEKEEKKSEKKDKNKEILNKKRKPRVHLEDIGIDPEIIKDKKFQTIGDKVYLSKNKILTEEDKKEVRAIRNRISAQKSRDRKKAEFSLYQKQVKYLEEQLKLKNTIIQNYEKVCCEECKAKFEEINKKILSDNNNNINIYNNGELILEEDQNDQIIPNRNNNSILGKIPGILIGIFCFIAISICIFQFNFSPRNKNIPVRNLQKHVFNANNIINTKEKENNEEAFTIYEEPPTIISSKNEYIQDEIEIKEENEILQMCHDKYIFDIYSNAKIKQEEKQKSGFLVKKEYNKPDPNSFCFETNTITNGNYYINNNFTNTLPIQSNNIILNEYLSKKIISVYIKDYESLKKYANGKLLNLKEQIEYGAKNSEDGCIYLQLILPKSEFGNDYEKNNTYPNNNEKYFEIRAKILSYYNYYDRGV